LRGNQKDLVREREKKLWKEKKRPPRGEKKVFFYRGGSLEKKKNIVPCKREGVAMTGGGDTYRGKGCNGPKSNNGRNARTIRRDEPKPRKEWEENFG